MISYNSENNTRDIRQFCRPLFVTVTGVECGGATALPSFDFVKISDNLLKLPENLSKNAFI